MIFVPIDIRIVSFYRNSLTMVVANSQGGGNDGDLESRYAHLVKPIRDLTKNWQMNIAADLAEYLDEVSFTYN